MFADTRVLKTKFDETRVLKKHKKFYIEKKKATLKQVLTESLKNVKVTQKSYSLLATSYNKNSSWFICFQINDISAD